MASKGSVTQGGARAARSFGGQGARCYFFLPRLFFLLQCMYMVVYTVTMKTPPVPSGDSHLDILNQIKRLWPAAKGSVAQVHKPCVRKNCRACAEGRKHRAFILAYKDGRRRRCLYVPEKQVAALRAAIANGRRIEHLLSRCAAEMVKQARQQQ